MDSLLVGEWESYLGHFAADKKVTPMVVKKATKMGGVLVDLKVA